MNYFRVQEVINQILIYSFNFVSKCIFALSFHKKKILQKNLIYKNKHTAQRCFIIGCGPSLKNLTTEQINKLTNEITFGVNELFKSEFLAHLSPTYYFMVDNAYWEKEISQTKAAKQYYKNKQTTFFSSWKARKVFKTHLDLEDINYIYSRLYPIDSIRCNLESNQTISMNVVNQCIMTALYMGFSEIYLLGCDYSAFATPFDQHCYDNQNVKPKEHNLAFYLKYYEITTKNHYLLKKYADQLGVKIINITPHSLLDAYPKKDVSAIL